MKSANSNHAVFMVFTCVAVGLFPGAIHDDLAHRYSSVLKKYLNDTHSCNGVIQTDVATNRSRSSITLEFRLAEIMFHVGRVAGTMTFMAAFKYASRKHLLMTLNLLCIIATMLMSPVAHFAHIFSAFIVGRLIVGIAYGMFVCFVPIMIAETVSKSTRILYLSMIPATVLIGAFVVYFSSSPGILGTLCLWPLAVALPAVPSIAALFLLPFTHNTVTWMILQENQCVETKYMTRIEDQEDAKRMRKLYSRKSAIRPSFVHHSRLRAGDKVETQKEYMKTLNEIVDDSLFHNMTTWQIIRHVYYHKMYRDQILTSFLAMLGSLVGGRELIEHIHLLTAEVLELDEARDQVAAAMLATLLFMIAPCAAMIRHFGSRPCYLTAMLVETVGLSLLSVGTQLPASLFVVSLVLVEIGIIFTSLCKWFIPVQFTTAVNLPICLAIAQSAYEFCGLVLWIITPLLWDAWKNYAIIPFVVMTAFTGIILYFYLPAEMSRVGTVATPGSVSSDTFHQHVAPQEFSNNRSDWAEITCGGAS